MKGVRALFRQSVFSPKQEHGNRGEAIRLHGRARFLVVWVGFLQMQWRPLATVVVIAKASQVGVGHYDAQFPGYFVRWAWVQSISQVDSRTKKLCQISRAGGNIKIISGVGIFLISCLNLKEEILEGLANLTAIAWHLNISRSKLVLSKDSENKGLNALISFIS